MKLNVVYFYPQELNLYGDRGNVEILSFRARQRGLDVNLQLIGLGDAVATEVMANTHIVLMGGGPDSSQEEVYMDLLKNKGPYIKDYIDSGGYGLYVCGSYQLLGNYYKDSSGKILKGLEAFDMYTEHFGKDKPRCIGNVIGRLSTGDTVTGFENHGGRTYLGENLTPFATVLKGCGNNGEDRTEGVWFKNSIGTYLHGPLFAKNPNIADYLIASSLKLGSLSALSVDSLTKSAHNKSLKFK